MTQNTQDFSKFGYRELSQAGDLLKAYAEGKWASCDDEFYDGLKVEFNPHSGIVFLVDDDCRVAVLNDKGELENWLSCGVCGSEGMRSEVDFDDDCTCKPCSANVLQRDDEICEAIGCNAKATETHKVAGQIFQCCKFCKLQAEHETKKGSVDRKIK